MARSVPFRITISRYHSPPTLLLFLCRKMHFCEPIYERTKNTTSIPDLRHHMAPPHQRFFPPGFPGRCAPDRARVLRAQRRPGLPRDQFSRAGYFLVLFHLGWDGKYVFFYARGLISRVSAEKKNCVFLVFFGVFVVFGGVFVLLSIFLRA